MLEQCGGSAASYPVLIRLALKMEQGTKEKDTTPKEKEQAANDTKEAYPAFVFLSNTNKIKFASLLREPVNNILCEHDKYPQTISIAHTLLVGWKGGSYTIHGASNDGIIYTNLGENRKHELLDKDGNMLVTSDTGQIR
eukprot:7925763-Ditylum_brightwellii.AAC.1